MIDRLGANQLGIVTRAQLLNAGVSRETIAARVRARRLRLVHRGVYQVGPVAPLRSREMAAVLACGPGSALSHVTAAGLWKLMEDAGDSAPIHVIPASDRGRRPGIRAYRNAPLLPDEITCVESLPVTNPVRTLIDLACILPLRTVEQAFARGERAGLIRREDLLAGLRRNRTRIGTRMLRALLDSETAPALTRSKAEERFLELVRKAQLAEPASNATIGKVEVDFYWRKERLVVEVDGYAFHASKRRFEGDRRRDAVLTASGLRIMRVTWHQIIDEPEAVLVRLAQALVR